MSKQIRRKDRAGAVLKNGEYQRKDGLYEYKYIENKKRHSIYAKDLQELRKKVNEHEKIIRFGLDSDKQGTSLDDLFNIWKQVKRGISITTRRSYLEKYNKHIHPVLGNSFVSSITKTIIRRFYITLYESGLSIGSIKLVHCVLHQLLSLAVEEKIIPTNPSDNAIDDLIAETTSDSKNRYDIHPLTVNEERLFVSYLENSKRHLPEKWFYLILLNTGMRIGEAAALTWDDIDFSRRLIHVKKTLVYCEPSENSSKEFSVKQPKTHNSLRDIPMSNDVIRYLTELRDWQIRHHYRQSVTINSHSGFVFVHRSGTPYYTTEANRKLQSIITWCNKAVKRRLTDTTEIQPVLLPDTLTPHVLRHTFGTRSIEAGMSPKTLQMLMGHASIQITMDLYVHPTDDFKFAEMELLDNYRQKQQINNGRSTTDLRHLSNQTQRDMMTYVDPFCDNNE